jgi:uncharacterized protein (TIGR03083 family)
MRGVTSMPDPDVAVRLLTTERDAMLPLLRGREPSDFDLPTVCEGWSVRDVLAHCGSALVRAADGRLHGFTPEDNEADVAERRAWPVADVVAELEVGYRRGADAVAAAGGALDALALGVWVHGGDVRDALGEPWAYGSAGAEDALTLLVARSRARSAPPVRAVLGGREVDLGTGADGAEPASLHTDLPTLFRLYAGRRPDPARYRLSGAGPADLLLFS